MQETVKEIYSQKTDTVRVRDTLQVYQKGDTVFIRQKLYSDRIIRDTIVKESKENKQVKQNKTEKAQRGIGREVLVVIAIICLFVWIIIKREIKR